MSSDTIKQSGAAGDLPKFAKAAPALVVVTVHGTNDSDDRDEGARWWQRGSAFTTRLVSELNGRGIAPVVIRPVHWSGANSDFDRLTGAASLARTIDEVGREDSALALIGHSHGGNVTMEALGLARRAPHLAGVVTFGTPFFVRRLKLVPQLIAVFQILLGLVMTPVSATFLYMTWDLYSRGATTKIVEFSTLFVLLAGLCLWSLVAGVRTITRGWRSGRRIRSSIGEEDWLVVHSPRDEAMRLLETAVRLKPSYVTSSWGVRSLSRLASLGGVLFVIVVFAAQGSYFVRPLVTKVMAGEYSLGTMADLTFLLVVPIAFLMAWLAIWIFARLGGGWLYALVVNHIISGGLVGAAYGGDYRDHLVRVERQPPVLPSVMEARIEALNLGGIDEAAVFESAQEVYESILAEEAAESGFGDPDRMWKALSDALYHNAYMRDAGVIATVADHIAQRHPLRR